MNARISFSRVVFDAFRTATENGGGWVHPGLKATNILDDAFKAAVENLDTEVMPNIIGKIISKL